MIGWENNQGAYFVKKLQEQVEDLDTDISSVERDVAINARNIGKMSDLSTTAKDTLVKAINELVSRVYALEHPSSGGET